MIHHSAVGKFTHSEKSIPPELGICCSIGKILPPKPGSLKSCSGNGMKPCGGCCGGIGCGKSGCWLSGANPVIKPDGEPRSRLMTSEQRAAKRLLPKDGWAKSALVVSMSWSQLGASGLEGSVMKKTMGIRPAWNRKYLGPELESEPRGQRGGMCGDEHTACTMLPTSYRRGCPCIRRSRRLSAVRFADSAFGILSRMGLRFRFLRRRTNHRSVRRAVPSVGLPSGAGRVGR